MSGLDETLYSAPPLRPPLLGAMNGDAAKQVLLKRKVAWRKDIGRYRYVGRDSDALGGQAIDGGVSLGRAERKRLLEMYRRRVRFRQFGRAKMTAGDCGWGKRWTGTRSSSIGARPCLCSTAPCPAGSQTARWTSSVPIKAHDCTSTDVQPGQLDVVFDVTAMLPRPDQI